MPILTVRLWNAVDDLSVQLHHLFGRF